MSVGVSKDLPLHLKREIDCKQTAVRAVRFNVDGNYCITCGADKTLKLWNPVTGIPLKTYTGTGWEVLDAQGSCDNAKILAGGLDKRLNIFDVETGKILQCWRDHNGSVNSVAFNNESTMAFSGCQDGKLRCFDLRVRGSPVQTLDEATDAILSIDVGEHEITSGSADCYMRVYNLRDGIMTMDYLGESITCVTLTADGQCVLASTKDGIVRLMDKSNGQLLADYSGHTGKDYRIESCLLSTDAHIVSGSADGNVYIWDMIEMSVLARLEHVHHSVVHSVSSHPTKPYLLSAAGGSVFLWMSKALDEER
uniref:WD repeat domain-containing protein 83 n=1 Tax=Syphacia muris TaxID=451379 RepID=A0A0N5AH90_9BILA